MKGFIKTTLCVALLVSASSWARAQQDGVIRIGATFRMISDEGQAMGKMLVDEFDDINKKGGINGHKVEVVTLNDECKSDKGVTNAIKIINDIKAHILVGSHCSAVTNPIVDVTNRSKIPQIVPSSTASDFTRKGSPWVFRVAVSERFFKAVMGKYIAEKVGKKIAYIWTTDAASQSFAKNILDYMQTTYSVSPVFQVQANDQDVDFRPYLLQIKATSPDGIVIAAATQDMAKILVQANEVGIPASVARVTSSVAASVVVPDLAGDAVVGLTYATPVTAFDDRPEVKTMVNFIKSRYGVAKPDIDFAQTYELIQILKKALSTAKLSLTASSLAADREAIRDALASIKDYKGSTAGPISFCADPTPQCRDGNRTLELAQYTKGGKDYETKVVATYSFDPDFGL